MSRADEFDLHLTTLRPGPVYGERDPKLTERPLTGLDRRIAVLPTAGIPLVHARDVADAAVHALDRPESIGQPYSLAGPPSSPAFLVCSWSPY
ncbi:MAG: NAD-dependent epimerase/dehydratase family protein [Myxococcota bacterium]